jgi:transcriptional regulator with GAF, ATPase, and Fis domain
VVEHVPVVLVGLIYSLGEGQFRDDLFYRINVASLKIPPLREREDDIPLLASHFLEKFGREIVLGRLHVGGQLKKFFHRTRDE